MGPSEYSACRQLSAFVLTAVRSFMEAKTPLSWNLPIVRKSDISSGCMLTVRRPWEATFNTQGREESGVSARNAAGRTEGLAGLQPQTTDDDSPGKAPSTATMRAPWRRETCRR